MATFTLGQIFQAGVILLSIITSSRAAMLPLGFTETLVTSGLSSPTAFAFAPDGRLFVCQQGGQLRVIKNGSLLSTPFLTVPTDSAGERGLLGVAFDPNFATNQFVFVYYTVNTTPRFNRVSRFTANGDVGVAGSEMLILQLDNLSSATNHNGGSIHFGPDGKLYIAVGENANSSNSQTLTTVLGKILRLNSDGTIPSDNPFFGVTSGNNRAIFALGLRNPFTFTFQPNTGRMFINDVGENTWEEINDGIAGSNYGWPATEGFTSNPLFRSPLFQYGHGNTTTTGCAITGGAFYNPAINRLLPQYTGQYFFADFCGGWIRVFDPATGQAAAFATGISSPVDLTTGPDGYLYYLARDAGAVFKVGYATAATLQTGTADIVYSQMLTVSGGTPPYSWALMSGALPPGLSLSSAGVLSGTPVTPGTYSFTVGVTDSASAFSSHTFTLTVLPPSLNFTNALRIAQIADGGNFITQFAIVNLEPIPTSFQFKFWGDDGSPSNVPIQNGIPGNLTGTLAPGATAFAQTTGQSSPGLQGWAEVASTGRIGVQAIFKRVIPGLPDSEATASGTQSGNNIFLPFDNTQEFVTGVAVSNTNPTQSLDVFITFIPEGGAASSARLSLPPHGHTAFVLPTAYPVTVGGRGTIQFSGSSPDIAVLGLRFSPNNSFTSLGSFQ